MARNTTNIDWHEIGFWTQEDGKHTWHCVGAYLERSTAEGDLATRSDGSDRVSHRGLQTGVNLIR